MTLVQHEYYQVFEEDPPHKTNIYSWVNSLRRQEAYTTERVLVGHMLATNQLKTLETVSFTDLRKKFVNVLES